MNINELLGELAQYRRIAEEAAEQADKLKDQVIEYMTEKGLEVLQGAEHKAIYKTVMGSRLDGAALRRELPEVAARYTVETEQHRFNFS